MVGAAGGRVLVGGGTGFVGGAVVRALERKGYEAIIISRSSDPRCSRSWTFELVAVASGAVVVAGVSFLSLTPLAALLASLSVAAASCSYAAAIRWTAQPKKNWTNASEVDSSKSLRRLTWKDLEADGLPSGTVGVVNTAGQNVLDPLRRWSDKLQKELYESRVMTNKVLAKAIEQARVPPLAFVSMSGVAFYPPSTEGSSPHTEESPGGDHDFMARLARDWEKAAVLPTSVETRCVQLRSGVVLGRTGGMVQQTILPFFFGLGGRMGSGQQAMPWIHVKDLADLTVHCLESPNCSGVYNAVAPEVVTNNQFVKAFAGALNRPAIFPAPEFVFNLIFGKERASIVTQSQVVQPVRTLQSGFEYQFPTIGEACEEFAHLNYVDPDDMK